MKTSAIISSFTLLIASTIAAPNSKAPQTVEKRAVAGTSIAAVDIPPACKVCDAVGIACIAACIAGGPIDPLCDFCAGPTVWTCITCISQN